LLRKILITIVVIVVAVLAWSFYKVSTYDGSSSVHRVEIDAERPIVWHYLTEAGYRKLWMADLEDLTAMGGIPGQVGERTLITLSIDGVPYEYIEETTALDPPTFWRLKLEAEGFEGQRTYELDIMDGSGTLLTLERSRRYTSLTAVILEPFFERAEQQSLENSLTRLKNMAESAPEKVKREAMADE